MKRSAAILLVMLMALMIEPLGPWQAQNRARQVIDTQAARSSAADARAYPALTVPFDEGSFKLTDLRLARVGASTKLSGKLVNQTKRLWPSVVFAVKAYDSNGKELRGVERETIFGCHQLGKGKSTPINSGYGVWLEGIPLSAISRLEVVLLDNAAPAAHASRKARVEIEE